MGVVTFTFRESSQTLGEEDARWLLGQLHSAHDLSAAGHSVAAKLSEASSDGSEVETTLDEKRELVDALERGAAKPRSGQLRRLEIELRTAVYTETYFSDQ